MWGFTFAGMFAASLLSLRQTFQRTSHLGVVAPYTFLTDSSPTSRLLCTAGVQWLEVDWIDDASVKCVELHACQPSDYIFVRGSLTEGSTVVFLLMPTPG